MTSSMEASYWWSLGTSSLAFVLLFGCVVSLRVRLDVRLAAVTTYLLIAFSFGAIYNLTFQLDLRSFALFNWIELGSLEAVRTEMIYFSLVTPVTLGYDDILPRSPFTQMLAVLEVAIGQFFNGGISLMARGDVHL